MAEALEARPVRKVALTPEQRDAQRAYMQEYRKANKERIARLKSDWYQANRDAVLQRTADWYESNKPRVLAYHVDYHEKNVEALREKTAQWKRDNPDRVAVQRQRRRALKKGVGGDLSKDIVSRLMVLQRGLCACCRSDLKATGHHLDHCMPLALGGANADENMQLLCPPCNCSKNAKHPVDFMQQRGYLL